MAASASNKAKLESILRRPLYGEGVMATADARFTGRLMDGVWCISVFFSFFSYDILEFSFAWIVLWCTIPFHRGITGWGLFTILVVG